MAPVCVCECVRGRESVSVCVSACARGGGVRDVADCVT